MNNDAMAFRHQLRALRLRAQMTQESLGLACGWGQSRIANYEKGDREPRMDEVPVLASALGCDISELFIEQAESSPSNDQRHSRNQRLDVPILAAAVGVIEADETVNGVYPPEKHAALLLDLYDQIAAGANPLELVAKLTNQRPPAGEMAHGAEKNGKHKRR